MRKRWLAGLFLMLAVLALAPAVRAEEPEDTPWLTGRVLDPDGTPIAGAGVMVIRTDPRKILDHVSSQEDGWFLVQKLPPGPVQLTIEADGYESLERRIGPGSADLPLVVVLPREDSKSCRAPASKPPSSPEPGSVVVTGRVLGLEPKDARRGIHVLLQRMDAALHQAVGADGTFRFENLPFGVWEVIADAGAGRVAGRSLVLYEGQTEAAVDLEIPGLPAEESGSAKVQAVDRDGWPISGATVHAGLPEGAWPGTATTATGGTARLSDLPANRALWLLIERKGFVSEVRDLKLRPGEHRDLRITLFPGVRATGQVVDESGQPVAGAEVALSGHLLGPVLPDDAPGFIRSRATLRTRTNRAGRFRFDDLPERDVTLLLQDPSFVPRREVHTIDGSDLGKIVLRRGVPLAGVVTDRDGRPVEGMPLRAFIPGMADDEAPAFFSLTGPDGTFFLPHVPAAGLALSSCSELYTDTWDSVETTGHPVHLTVIPGAVVRGRVLDPYGRPVAGAEVSPSPARIDPLDSYRHDYWHRCSPGPAITDTDGRFSIGPLPPDWYDLEAQADGWRRSRARMLRADAGRAVEGIEIRLQRAAVVSGRVLDAQGAPIAGAEVASLISRAWTRKDGSFRLADVPFGESSLSIKTLNTLETVRREVEVTSGEARIDLRLTELSKPVSVLVHGRVIGPDGTPVEGALISNRSASRAWSAADGSFAILVPVGERGGLFTVHRRGFAIGWLPESPEGAPAGGFEIHLRPGTTVAGRVLGLTGDEPDPSDQVTLFVEGYPLLSVALGTDGTFRLRDVPPGTWELFTQVSGRQAKATVVVPPGPAEVRADLQLPSVTAVKDLEIRLERYPPTAALRGRLLGILPGDRPELVATALRPTRPRDEPPLHAEVALDAYSLTGLKPGLWSLEARSSACTLRRTIEVPPGATEIELDLDFTPPAARAEETP